MKTALLSFLLFSFSQMLAGFHTPSNSGQYSSFTPWWFMGGADSHVHVSATEDGIQNLVEGNDTCPGEAWKNHSRLPNAHTVPSASYITNSFTIEGNHEIEFVFSIDCINEDNTVNYKSQNNLFDIDIFVFNSANDAQLASLRIWYDAGGFNCGNHSYALGVGNNWPSGNCANWISGDAKLSSSFLINFSKEHLFRSYVNKSTSSLMRLENSSNSFLINAAPLFENVDNIYFLIRGDGGWQKQATVILRSINGQSLSTVDDKILDNKAPDIYETSAVPASLEKGVEYTIPVKACDVLSHPTIKYFYDNVELVNNKVTPSENGAHTIKVEATDGFENVSSKEYHVNIVNALTPPTIVSLPTINDQTLKTEQFFRCGVPVYEDETGTGTISAKLYQVGGSLEKTLIYDSEENEFYIQVDEDFTSGNYKIIYTITNSIGSTVSDPINFSLEIIYVSKPDFVTYDDGISVRYVDEGLLVHSIGRWRKVNFGIFDIRHGADVYATIPIKASNGGPNTASYFDMQFVNAENDKYWIMYRIWLDEQFLTNDSSPTNMFFNFGTPGNSQCVDVNDCGWLSRDVGGVDGRFHLNFDMTNGFSGEFRRVLKSAEGSGALTTRFFDEAGSNNFYVLFYVASRDGGVGDDQNSEFIINEINNQNLENTNGNIDVIARPNVVIGTIDSVYKANTTSYVNMYVKDILNLHPIYNVRFINENGDIVKEKSYSSSPIPLEIPDIGIYKMKIFTVNKRGKEVGKTFDIEARSSLDPVEVTLEQSYSSNLLPGDSVTIIGATYSANTDLSKVKITLIRGEETREVSVGDIIELEKAGMYVLDYYACDNATPHPNETHYKVYLNVFDTVKPILNISVTGSLRAEEEVNVHVDVIDDTECDTAIIVTDTNGYKTTFFGLDASFIPQEKGEYTLTVRTEDSYNNIVLETITIKISQKAANKTLISWIVIGMIFASMLGAFIALTSVASIRRKKGIIS